MDRVLYFLRDIGLIADVPKERPARGTVLARSVCPLHDNADCRRGFLVYADGFVCHKGCHKERGLGVNLPGLIRHLAWKVTGREMPWREAWRWANNHRDELRELVGDKVRHARANGDGRRPVNYTADELAACLEVPDPFYLSRGYQPETLRHFGVGKCVRRLPDREDDYLSGWSVFPVFDVPGQTLVGYTARNPRWVKGGKAYKWHHALPVSEHLFNRLGVRLGRSRSLFICEGPGCVMRLWEAGFPHAVATFGVNFSDHHYGCLHGVADASDMTVYVAADNDEAGRAFAAKVVFRVGEGLSAREPVALFPPAGHKDLGDVPAADLREWLLDEVKAVP